MKQLLLPMWSKAKGNFKVPRPCIAQGMRRQKGAHTRETKRAF